LGSKRKERVYGFRIKQGGRKGDHLWVIGVEGKRSWQVCEDGLLNPRGMRVVWGTVLLTKGGSRNKDGFRYRLSLVE